jgi:hypothetical protein
MMKAVFENLTASITLHGEWVKAFPPGQEQDKVSLL